MFSNFYNKSKNNSKKPEWAYFLGGCHFGVLSLFLHTCMVSTINMCTSQDRMILCIKLLRRHIWTPPAKSPRPSRWQALPNSPLPMVGIPLCSEPRVYCIYLLLFKKSVQREAPALPKRLGYSASLEAGIESEDKNGFCHALYSAQDQAWHIADAT